MKPLIALTLGDPAGIGPEIILKTFAGGTPDSNLVVIGDLTVLERAKADLRYTDVTFNSITSFNQLLFKPGVINIIDLNLIDTGNFRPGKISYETGDASFKYIIEAIRLAVDGDVKAIVTAPICKEAIQLAGHNFAGHTEIFAKYTGSKNYAMLL